MIELDKKGYNICLHVHDEVGAEVPLANAESEFKKMCATMEEGPHWALGLPLRADGYISTYYKKD